MNSDEEIYRVAHIPQIPMEPFYRDGLTLTEAVKIQDVLADYDLFQFAQKIKPDYSNVSWVEKLVEGEWEEFDLEEMD